MSGLGPSVLEEIARGLQELVGTDHPNANLIRKPWGQDSVRVDWIESSGIRKNIIAHVRNGTVVFEGHAWKDTIEEDKVVRSWEPFENVRTIEVGLVTDRQHIEEAISESLKRVGSVREVEDLGREEILDLSKEEIELLKRNRNS